MAKKLYDAMVADVERRLDGNTVDLISHETGVKKNGKRLNFSR